MNNFQKHLPMKSHQDHPQPQAMKFIPNCLGTREEKE